MAETQGLDEEAARTFLREGRSRFQHEAAEWLVGFDDPSVLLLMLSREVGQALGPWETYRTCALLGLGKAASVRELGLDVLAEPAPAPGRVPPIAPAMAIAHAVDQLGSDPDAVPAFADAVGRALQERADGPGGHPALLAAARLALHHPAGGAPAPSEATAAAAECHAQLAGADGERVAGPIWEAAALADDDALARAAERTAAAGQQEDGGLVALSSHGSVRGFATLRTLALIARARAPQRG